MCLVCSQKSSPDLMVCVHRRTNVFNCTIKVPVSRCITLSSWEICFLIARSPQCCERRKPYMSVSHTMKNILFMCFFYMRNITWIWVACLPGSLLYKVFEWHLSWNCLPVWCHPLHEQHRHRRIMAILHRLNQILLFRVSSASQYESMGCQHNSRRKDRLYSLNL